MKDREFHWQLVTFFRLLFAAHLIYSGTAYVLFGWVPSAFYDEASPVGQFMVALDDIGLYAIVKYVELFLGIVILSNRFVALAAVAELPITLIIAYLNIFVEGALDTRHYYTGVQELTINAVVLFGYGAYYRTMLEPRPRPQWLWQPLDTEPALEGPAQHPFGAPQTWIMFAVVMALVVTASWLLGPVDRKLPPRDWLPPLLAFLGTLGLFRLTLSRRNARSGAASYPLGG